MSGERGVPPFTRALESLAMTGWKSAFVAAAALVGEPVEAVRASLDGLGEAEDLMNVIERGSREARARAIAVAMARVAEDLETLRLA
jgi:glycine cleavage system regulatory protein